MRKAVLPPPSLQELAVQRRKQPGFHFGPISQLMAFSSPDIKRLLSQIARIGFRSGEAECELIQGPIVILHKIIKIQAHGLLGTGISMTHGEANCSRYLAEARHGLSSLERSAPRTAARSGIVRNHGTRTSYNESRKTAQTLGRLGRRRTPLRS